MGKQDDLASPAAQRVHDAALHAAVEQCDARALPWKHVCLVPRDLADEIPGLRRWDGSGQLDGGGIGALDDDTALQPVGAKMAHETPRIDLRESGHGMSAKEVVEPSAGAVVRRRATTFPDDEPRDVRAVRLPRFGRDAVVADEGIGHHHDLAAVAWVAEDLLIPGHARGEHDLAA